jgi:hypothetical protein
MRAAVVALSVERLRHIPTQGYAYQFFSQAAQSDGTDTLPGVPGRHNIMKQ